jgi:hypothetical protein
MTRTGKREYLVGYDYGMGGLRGVIVARSIDEILAKYPELTILSEPPKWMTSERLDQLRSNEELLDIDGEPRGLLTSIVADRAHR